MIVNKIMKQNKKMNLQNVMNMENLNHNTNVNILEFTPLQLVTGKNVAFVGASSGNIATES